MGRAIFLLAIVQVVISCRTGFPRDRDIGTDYFRRDFRCKTGPLRQEAFPRYLRHRRYVRSMYRGDNERRKSVFAVMTGDSTAMLFTPERMRRHLPGLEIVNRGMGGETTLLLRDRFTEDVLALKPRVIVLVIGGNDLIGGRCLPLALRYTREILDMIRATLPRTRVVLVGIPPTLTWKANTISLFYSRRLQETAREFPGVVYQDLWNVLGRKDFPALSSLYHFYPRKKLDKIHFNEKGYRAWGGALMKLLRKMEPDLKLPTGKKRKGKRSKGKRSKRR